MRGKNPGNNDRRVAAAEQLVGRRKGCWSGRHPPAVVTSGATGVVLVKLLIGIVDAATGEIEADLVVLAHDLGEPAGGLDDLELAIYEPLLQLIGQDHRR